MPVEIERKFLVNGDSWRAQADEGRHFLQGYIVGTDQVSVRVRIVNERVCTLTTKLPRCGMSRFEFENDISPSEAKILLEMCEGVTIEKVRYNVRSGEDSWEVDVFGGANQGLIVAEIELRSETQTFARPGWLGREVTGKGRYQNSALVKRPYSSWSEREGAGTVEPAVLSPERAVT